MKLIHALLVLLSVVILVSCKDEFHEATQPSPQAGLRDTARQRGPQHLLDALNDYANPRDETIRSKADQQFLLEIARQTVEDPKWVTQSPDYARARSLAIYFLALDHQNGHFALSHDDIRLVRDYSRSVLLNPRSGPDVRREALRSLGATAELTDISVIESVALRSSDANEVQEAAVSLALICDPSAGLAMDRILSTKENMLSSDFRRIVVKARDTKQQHRCAAEPNAIR